MTKGFSCFCSKTCCLVKCFSKRVSERTVFRSRNVYNVPSENVQMIDMSNVQPAQNPNRNDTISVNSIRRTLTPSASNMSLDSNISTRGILLNQNRQPFCTTTSSCWTKFCATPCIRSSCHSSSCTNTWIFFDL